MVQTIDKNLDSILAIGRLYDFSSKKRFHLIKNEFLNDGIGKKALEINQKIKNSKGIDIFEATSEIDLIEYENILNQYTSTETNIIIGNISLGDEDFLLKTQVDFSVDKLKTYKIAMNSFLKPLIKKNNLIVPDVVNACKSANKASFVKECGSIFVIKRIKVKTRNKLMLFHLTFDNPEQTIENNKIGMSKVGEDLENSPGLRIAMLFFFDENDYLSLVNNPIRLFIRALDLYAENLNIGTQLKKFYYHVLLPAHIRVDNLGEYLMNLQTSGLDDNNIKTVAMSTISEIQLKLKFIYAINFNKMLKN